MYPEAMSIAGELDRAEAEQLPKLDVCIEEMAECDGALIPVLQRAQELFGYLPHPVLKHIARKLKLPYSQVAGVVTFYSYFSTVPRGEHTVRVCLGTACYVRGGKEVLESIRNELGMEVGDTTPDRCFSLEVGRCFGACGLAPVVMIDDEVKQGVKPHAVRALLEYYRDGNDGAERIEGRDDKEEAR